MRLLTTTCLVIFSLASRAAAEDVAARFDKSSNIEIIDSAKLLDLNEDFTIEVWTRWTDSDRVETIAGDEAWPGMSSEVKVAENRGWTLRKSRDGQQEILDFTVGMDQITGGWFSLKAELPRRTQDWIHLAVCRRNDSLLLFADGKRLASASVKGKTLLKSPTPMYLGVRKHAFGDRSFFGYIRGFRVSYRARYAQTFPAAKTLKFKKDDDPLILFNFDKVTETQIVDASGHNHHGRLDGVELIPLKK